VDCKTRAKQLVEAISALLVLINMIWMAVEVEFSINAARNHEEQPGWLLWGNVAFAFVFTLEIFVKIFLYRSEYFLGPARRWNFFDIGLVAFQLTDLIVSTANLTFFRVLRGMRFIRASRIVKTIKIVPELRLMVASIAVSAGSIFWGGVLLFLVLFLWSMGVAQVVQTTLEGQGAEHQHPMLMEFYGNLPSTMLTLFMAISGGKDWRDLAEPLEYISILYLIVFTLFMMIMVFGMLNILTAVFVEATANIVKVDPEYVFQESLDGEASNVKTLRSLLREADVDETGTITREEFEDKLSEPKFRTQLHLMELNIFEAQSVFGLLDAEKTNDVAIEDLVFGLMRLKGAAKAMDVMAIVCDNRRMMQKLNGFIKLTNAHFRELRSAISTSAFSDPYGVNSPGDTPQNQKAFMPLLPIAGDDKGDMILARLAYPFDPVSPRLASQTRMPQSERTQTTSATAQGNRSLRPNSVGGNQTIFPTRVQLCQPGGDAGSDSAGRDDGEVLEF